MKIISKVFEILFVILGLALLAAVVRYPKATFIDIPLGILKRIFYIDDFLESNEEYQTEKRIIFNFSECAKFLLAIDANENSLRNNMYECLSILNQLSISDFSITKINDDLIIRPKLDISFYDFHFLVQWLTEHGCKSIGIVESAKLTYSVYNDSNSSNLIGQTTKTQKFLISLMEDYESEQFISVSNEIQINQDYSVGNLKRRMKGA